MSDTNSTFPAGPSDSEPPELQEATNPTAQFGGRMLAPGASMPPPGSVAQWLVKPPDSESVTPVVAGQYELVRIIGRGGMGEVWEAVQTSLDRVVAVKRVRLSPGESSVAPQQFLEFRQEAVISGRLEHPNIVPVHDIGHSPDGAPMLSMKLVEGEPWNKVLADDFDTLDVPDLLAKHLPILIDVGQAVAFAHSRGIIHRDLKPAQVMIGRFGETMLMDWGLALAFGEVPKQLRTPIPTQETASSPCGTPAMMAPEQTDDDAGRCGPWTDVYLLGGTLYFLLTKTYPHKASNVYAAFHHAREEEVQPPESRAPGRDIPPELSRLALECMRRNPEDRVKSAAQFVERLQDYLSGASRRREARELHAQATAQAATAGADYQAITSALEQVSRAMRLWPEAPGASELRDELLARYAGAAIDAGDLRLARIQAGNIGEGPRRSGLMRSLERAERTALRREQTRKLAIRGLLAAGLLIIIGGSVFIAQLRRAWKEESDQRQLAEQSSALAEQRRAEAEAMLAVARAQGKGAYDVIDYILRDLKSAMDEELSAERGVSTPAARQISQAIAGRVASPVVDYFRVVETDSWPNELRLEHAQRMLRTASRFGQMGRYAEGLALTTPTLVLHESLLGPDHPETARSLTHIASFTWSMGAMREALPLMEAALAAMDRSSPEPTAVTGEILVRLSRIRRSVGDMQGALRDAERAVAVREKVHGEEDRLTGEALANLASVFRVLGRPGDALPIAERARTNSIATFGPDHPATANALSDLALIYEDLGRLDDAAETLLQVQDIRELRLGADHPDMGAVLNHRGAIYQAMGRYEEALPLNQRAAEVIEKAMGERHPNTAAAISGHAKALERLGRFEEALPLAERALSITEAALGPDHPNVAGALINLGTLANTLGDSDKALALYERAVAVREKTFGPDHPQTAAAISHLGGHLQARGELAAAKAYLERALETRLRALGPDHPLTAASRNNLAGALQSLGELDAARDQYEQALAATEKALGPDHADVAAMLNNIASVLAAGRHFEEADAHYLRALAIQEAALGADHALTGNTRLGLFHARIARARATTDATEAHAAWSAATAAVEGRWQLLDPSAKDRADLALALHRTGRLHEAQTLTTTLAAEGYPNENTTEEDRKWFEEVGE